MKFRCTRCKRITDWENGFMEQYTYGNCFSEDTGTGLEFICMECKKEDD